MRSTKIRRLHLRSKKWIFGLFLHGNYIEDIFPMKKWKSYFSEGEPGPKWKQCRKSWISIFLPGGDGLSECSVKKSLCLNRFILQTCPHGKFPTCNCFVIFFFWIERFFIRNRMPAQVAIGEQCSDMWFSDFNVLPEQAEEKEETWWREIKRRQEWNKSRQERESSLSLYRHTYFLYFPNSLFPFIDFFLSVLVLFSWVCV